MEQSMAEAPAVSSFEYDVSCIRDTHQPQNQSKECPADGGSFYSFVSRYQHGTVTLRKTKPEYTKRNVLSHKTETSITIQHVIIFQQQQPSLCLFVSIDNGHVATSYYYLTKRLCRNARLIRVNVNNNDNNGIARSTTRSYKIIKSARHSHKPSRWNETKSSTSVPRAPLRVQRRSQLL
jgi:hypothetical protein